MIPTLNLGTKTAVLGIGSDQGDDSVGPYIVQHLKPTPKLLPFDCGTTPENYLSKIETASPDQILIIDAADFGGKPGEAKIIDPFRLQLSFSTHNPTDMLIEFLTLTAPVTVLGIQPQSKTEFTEPVKKTAKEIIARLSPQAQPSQDSDQSQAQSPS